MGQDNDRRVHHSQERGALLNVLEITAVAFFLTRQGTGGTCSDQAREVQRHAWRHQLHHLWLHRPIIVCTSIVPCLYGKCHTAASPLVPAKSASPRWQWDALCDSHSRQWASWCDVRRCERHFPARDFGLQWDDT